MEEIIKPSHPLYLTLPEPKYRRRDYIIIVYNNMMIKREICAVHAALVPHTQCPFWKYELDRGLGLIHTNNCYIPEDEIMCTAAAIHKDVVL